MRFYLQVLFDRRPADGGRGGSRARAAARESASSEGGADSRRVRVVGRVRVLTDAHTTDERPARASEGRTPPPPPPLRGARGARSRALRFPVRTRGSVAAAASRRPSPSPRARAPAKLSHVRARARPVDDRETPLSTRSFRAQEGHSHTRAFRAARAGRRAGGGSARRAVAAASETPRARTPRVRAFGRAPIALSRARSSRVFPARERTASGRTPRPAAPRRRRRKRVARRRLGWPRRASLTLAEAIPHR